MAACLDATVVPCELLCGNFPPGSKMMYPCQQRARKGWYYVYFLASPLFCCRYFDPVPSPIVAAACTLSSRSTFCRNRITRYTPWHHPPRFLPFSSCVFLYSCSCVHSIFQKNIALAIASFQVSSHLVQSCSPSANTSLTYFNQHAVFTAFPGRIVQRGAIDDLPPRMTCRSPLV